MADIFISYSRNDSAKALTLAEQLRANGMDVWIDQHGIEGATSWSKEIANALQACHTMLLLLSPTAVNSKNVAKELSVATQLDKRIVPVQVIRTQLEGEFLYHLSPLQRVKIEDFDGIVRAISGTVRPSRAIKPQQPIDDRKSLMILPFEDLSPTGDNQWFADGIVSELIAALSNVKSLKLADSQSTKEFKRYQGQLTTYAHEMGIRYFVQGDVRKFGDQIKIGARLLDIDTGDHLWQDSLRGTMNDIFDIQEAVAKKVTDGLNVILTSEEKKTLAERGTENAEAYELSLKAHEYFNRHTREGFQLAAQLYSEAITLDPGYAHAYVGKANALAALYRTYDRNPSLLDEGLALLQEAKRLKPDLQTGNRTLSNILMHQGKLGEAERTAQDYIWSAPQDSRSHFSLGFFYGSTGQLAKSIAPFEESLRLNPDNLDALFNLALACYDTKEHLKQKEWALVAIPKFEKHLKLFPDDEHKRVHHALLLHWAGRDQDARAAAQKLNDLRDGSSLYDTAYLYCNLKDYASSLVTFRKAIEAGFRNIQLLKSFLDDDLEGIGTLKGTPEYEEVVALVDKLEQESLQTNNG